MPGKSKKIALKQLHKAQKLAREPGGRLGLEDNYLFVYSGKPNFHEMLESRAVSWRKPSHMGFPSRHKVTEEWLNDRKKQLQIWQHLMNDPLVKKSCKRELKSWTCEIAKLYQRVELLGKMLSPLFRFRTDYDETRSYPDQVCGHYVNEDRVLLSPGQMSFLKQIQRRATENGKRILPDSWNFMFEIVMWISGEQAVTRVFESIKSYLPLSRHHRFKEPTQRMLFVLRQLKKIAKFDPELALRLWQQAFDRWPKDIDIVAETGMIRPTNQRKLVEKIGFAIGRCQKLLASRLQVMPLRHLSSVAVLCCCDGATEPIPASLFVQYKPHDDSSKPKSFVTTKTFSLRIDYLHDHRREPVYDKLLRTLNECPEIVYGFEYKYVCRLLKSGTELQDLRWLIDEDLFDSMQAYDFNPKVIRQLFEFLEANNVALENDRKAEVIESVGSNKDLLFYERLLTWLKALPAGLIDKRLGKRIHGLLTKVQIQQGFRDICRAGLYSWATPPKRLQNKMPYPAGELADRIPDSAHRSLAELAYYQKMAGEEPRLPASLRKLLTASERRTRELNSLRRLARDGKLDAEAACRLEHLQRGEVPNVEVDIDAAKLTRTVQEARANAALDALTVLVRSLSEKWWDKIFPQIKSPKSTRRVADVCCWFEGLNDGQKASIIETFEVHANLVRKNGTAGDYRRYLCGNQRWIKTTESKGFKPGVWFSERSRMLSIANSNASMRICVVSDPIQTIRMGDYFSTCLNLRDGINRHSVVPNIYDANKAVIMAFDAKRPDIIRARKLVTITDDCELIPYHTYTNIDDGKNEKRIRNRLIEAIEIFCGEWACSAGLKLADSGKPTQLSHKWYDDGCIEWDKAAKDGFHAQTQHMQTPTASSSMPLAVSA